MAGESDASEPIDPSPMHGEGGGGGEGEEAPVPTHAEGGEANAEGSAPKQAGVEASDGLPAEEDAPGCVEDGGVDSGAGENAPSSPPEDLHDDGANEAEVPEWEKPSLPDSRVDWIRVEGLPADVNVDIVASAFKRFGQVVDAFTEADGSKPFVFVRLAGDSGASTEKARAEDAALCVDSAIRDLNQAEMGPDNTIVTVVKAPPLNQIFVGNISTD